MAWTTAGTGDGIVFPRKQEWVLKKDYENLEDKYFRSERYNRNILDENEKLKARVESLEADKFLKSIMADYPTIEKLKEMSDENDRLIAENNRLTAKISQITQILYDGDDDDDGCE